MGLFFGWKERNICNVSPVERNGSIVARFGPGKENWAKEPRRGREGSFWLVVLGFHQLCFFATNTKFPEMGPSLPEFAPKRKWVQKRGLSVSCQKAGLSVQRKPNSQKWVHHCPKRKWVLTPQRNGQRASLSWLPCGGRGIPAHSSRESGAKMILWWLHLDNDIGWKW